MSTDPSPSSSPAELWQAYLDAGRSLRLAARRIGRSHQWLRARLLATGYELAAAGGRPDGETAREHRYSLRLSDGLHRRAVEAGPDTVRRVLDEHLPGGDTAGGEGG